MKETLRTLFQQKFNPIEYRKVVLQNLLHAQQLLSQPQFLEETNDGDRIYGLGYLTDADGKQIGLYYTDVVNSDVRRKRVGFRQMMKKYTDFGVDAAIAVFADKEHWRLSYMSDLKGGETSAKRFSYILGDANGQYNTPVNRLAKLGTQVPRLRLKEFFEAFSVETLSDEFFDLYRDHYADIVEYLTGKRMVKVDSKWVEKVIHAPLQSVYEQLAGVENADKIVRDYVKKMMGRIVFLHFLQKKEWLNGNTNFMQHTFSRNKDCQDDFLEKILEPLFFGFLNTRKEERAKLFDKHPNWDKQLLTVWENIPYLNGGLFEQDEVDNLNIRLPRSMFDDLFTFLAEYNFTVDENDPDDAEVGVDPEMLGKIFESLLEDNKAKGAFYTPKEIVRYMCKESLIAYLSSRISELPCPAGRNLVNLVNSADASNCERSKANNNLQDSQDFASETSRSIRRFVEHHEMQPELEPYRDTLDTALRNVKICDPAIGSGAFPMGLLNELWRCREALYSPSPAGRDLVNLLESNHAVGGINQQDQRDLVSAASRSKLKKEIIENNIYGVDIEKGAIDIARLRFWLSIVVDAEEPEPLPNFDYKFMQGNSLIESYKGIDLSRISNRLRGGQSKSTQLLLGLDSDFSKKNLQRLMRDYFSVTDHKQKASMRQAINDEVKRLITDFIGGSGADLDKLDPSANQDFFLWHTWFKDIFDNSGFDIVIANPPYISAIEAKKTIDDFVRQQYKKSYITASGTYDIYVIFIELGFKLLRNDGILSYITPSKYLSAEYAKTLREVIIKYYSVEQISDFSSIRVFENAGVSTMISMFRKCKQKNTVRFESFKTTTEIESFHIYNKSVLSLLPNNLWGALLSNQIDLFLKIHSQSVTMEEFSEVNACSTAAEAEEYENSLISEFDPDSFMYINNGTINRYVQYWGRKEIRSKKILRPYLPFTALNSRRKNMFQKEKLIFVKLARCPQVFLDERGEFASANTNMVYDVKQYNYKFLLGYFNSRLFDYVYKTMFGGNSMLGSIQVQAPQIRKSLIPKLSLLEKQQPIIDIVEKILQEKRINPDTDTTSLEHQIDKLVYQLYNLTPEEIAIIEQ